MSIDWADHWRHGRTAFHEGVPNKHLVAHHAAIAGARRVLVPMCGKAEDLAWLAAQGHEVVGVELVAQGAEEFFAEHDLAPVRDGSRLRAGGIEIHVADVLTVTRDQLGPIDAIWDRAALIALPAEDRARYATHLRSLVDRATQLVVTIAYPDGAMTGPPYSVPDAELHALYAGAAFERLGFLPEAELARPELPRVAESCWKIAL